MAIGLGLTFGMLAAAVLFVPYLRKAGSYTLPSFFGYRFRSRLLRARQASCSFRLWRCFLPRRSRLPRSSLRCFCLSPSVAVILVAALIAAIAILGGMRSITWAGSAEFLVGAVGLAAVVTVVSILLT